MTTLAVDTTAVEVVEDVRKTGGSTRSVLPGVSAPAGGYMVSLLGHEERFTRWSDETVAEYIDRHRHVLAQPGRYVGAWLHEGDLYLDVSVNVAELSAALLLGRMNSQIAIYDVAGQREIQLDTVEPFGSQIAA